MGWLGFHVSKSGRQMADALRQDMEHLRGYGVTAPCAQIFVSGPQSYAPTLTNEDKAAVRNYVNEVGLKLVVHGAYVDNPWALNAPSINNIMDEMRTAAEIGAVGVIVHLSSRAMSSLDAVLTKLADLDKAIKRKVILFFEINAAKPGPNTFETPEKLANLFTKARTIAGNPADNPDALRIGLTIDSAHLYSCGVALDSWVATEKWIQSAMSALPEGTPVMLHLNDSACELGSGKDRHEALTKGNIWRSYHMESGHLKIEDSGLMYLLDWAEKNDVMVIMERHSGDVESDLNLISELGYFTS